MSAPDLPNPIQKLLDGWKADETGTLTPKACIAQLEALLEPIPLPPEFVGRMEAAVNAGFFRPEEGNALLAALQMLAALGSSVNIHVRSETQSMADAVHRQTGGHCRPLFFASAVFRECQARAVTTAPPNVRKV